MSALQLLLAVVLVLGNGFFVGAEFALVSVRRSQIEPLAAVHRRARSVLYGLENLPQMMAAAQFGITVCSLTLGAVAEPTVARLLEPLLHGLHVPEQLIHPIGYAVALAAVVFLHLVVGEMVPKNLAMAAPESTALRFGPGLVAFARLLRPVIAVLDGCAKAVLALFRVEPRDELESVFTSEELTRLVEDAGAAGLLGEEERRRLEDALVLGSRPVTDVLLAPDDLVTVGTAVTARELEELTVRTGYSRFPVADGGSFLGYLHVKDVLDLDDPGAPVPGRLRRPMTTLRDGTPLDDALTAMRRAATHMARVTDGQGRLLGLVTLEDVLEMLVGEVHDPAHRLSSGPGAGPAAVLAAAPAGRGGVRPAPSEGR
ncbi:hemolysin family protein [Streptomyces sp. HB2AG]|uniref:hemolysin family protein n=1 Tax=Streptomyces sp. HB2AG TaxID=2983400 RepID=UPI0022AA8D29|nr:hemolysin family protein [Streptomyces sp. HB2AG]MCZ2526158.1 hemolysin family protein [Streptomyces sp. HB2AG]